MQYVVLILGVLSAAAIWWYRLKMISGAARDVAATAGRVRGEVRRRSARRQVAEVALKEIADPVTGAATVLVAMAADEIPLTPKDERAIRAALLKVATPEETDDAIDHAKWVNSQLDDPAIIIDRLAPLMKARLKPDQRTEFISLIDAVKNGITYSSRYDQWRERVIDRLDMSPTG